MCFSATASFVGSGVLGAIGVVTLTKVKHRRELLFAALPTLFAVHQLIEGFVWLGLHGTFSPAVTHAIGAAFMLYAQGLLPFVIPLSVLLFESNVQSRRRMLPFLVIGGLTTLYMLWALTAYSLQVFIQGDSIVYVNQATNHTAVAVLYIIATCGSLFLFQSERHDHLWHGEPHHLTGSDGGQALCVHFRMVCLRSHRKCDHPRELLEEQHPQTV